MKKPFAIGILGGILVGAAVGLTLAPKTGKETRNLLSRRTDGFKDRAVHIVDNVKNRFNRELTLQGADDPAENGFHQN